MPFTNLRKAKENGYQGVAVNERVTEGRDRAAGFLSTTATRVRHGSKRASRIIDRGGTTVADTLQGASKKVAPEDAGHGSRRALAMIVVLAVAALIGFTVLRRMAMPAMYEGDESF